MAKRNYAAALAVVPGKHLSESAPKRWRSRVELWRRWLAVMERWDRFDHAGALKLVDRNGGAAGPLGRALAGADLLERLPAG